MKTLLLSLLLLLSVVGCNSLGTKVGVGYGYREVDLDSKNGGDFLSISDGSVGHVSAGVRAKFIEVGIEGNYSKSKVRAGDSNVGHSKTLGGSLLLRAYPLDTVDTDGLKPFILGGIGRQRIENRILGSNERKTLSSTIFGIGIDYTFEDSTFIRLEARSSDLGGIDEQVYMVTYGVDF